MMKLGGRCVVQKSQPSSNFWIIDPWVRTSKNVTFGYDVGKISGGCLVFLFSFMLLMFELAERSPAKCWDLS